MGSTTPLRPLAAGVVALAMLAAACAPRFDLAEVGQPSLDQPAPVATDPAAPPVVGEVPVEADLVAPGAPARQPRARSAAAPSDVAVESGPIRIGGLFPLSGGLSSLGKPAFEGAQAFFRWVNDNGGVRGRPIEFVVCDDQADDTRSTTCAKRLVEQDGVFVMGPSFTPFSLTVIDQLERAGVPWVGYDGINIEGFEASNVVTVGAPIETMAHALLPWWYDRVAADTGSPPRRIGAVVLDQAPAMAYVAEAERVICPRLGCEIVTKREVTSTVTEYGTICRAMQSARVDAVWIVTDPASAIKLLVQCQGIGYKPPKGFLGQHGIYVDITLQQAGPFADGIYANGAVLPESVDNAATREMKSIIRTYYPSAELGYFTQLAYASARMAVDLIEAVLDVGRPLSRANVLAAARSTGSYSCHGLCRAVNLAPPAARSGGNHNVWIVRADFSSGEGRWVRAAGPIDAFRARTWPCPGGPCP